MSLWLTRTKLTLSSVDNTPIVLNTMAQPKVGSAAPSSKPYRLDKSPSAPCVLKEHWQYSHTNGECARQQHLSSAKHPSNSIGTKHHPPVFLSKDERARRFGQLIAMRTMSFNTEVVNQGTTNAAPQSSVNASPSVQEPDCHFATSFNVMVIDPIEEEAVNISLSTSYNCESMTKPTYADSACNRHMYGDSLLLDDFHDIEPISIRVANNNVSSRIVARQMGTAKICGFDTNGNQTIVNIPHVLYTPSLPANLILVSALYNLGFTLTGTHHERH